MQALAQATPAGLAYLASSGHWRYAPHLRLLSQQLWRVAAGHVRRLMVFMPPRHGKSELVSHYFPAWYLGTRPNRRVILTSYEADFAASWGRKVRDVLVAYGPTVYGVRVRADSSAANRWDLADATGGMVTAGVGGPITGRGSHVLIVDDPLKNAEEAQSATMRERIWEWWRSTAYTRLEPNGAAVLVMTRWHEDDLAGRLLAEMAGGGEQWEVLSLPAIAEEVDDVLGRQPGEALWPERYDRRELARIRANVGAAWWAALYQQHPSPTSGGTFQRSWLGARYTVPPHLTSIIQAVDTAFKTGVASDYSVIATWGTDGRNYYLLHVWRDRVQYPDLKRALLDQYHAFRPDLVLIEDAASGQSVIQDLRAQTHLPIIAIPARGSKQSRADAVSPLFEAGRVYLPEQAPWLGDWIEEHVSFPRGAHDDCVDTTAIALQRLARDASMTIPVASTRLHLARWERDAEDQEGRAQQAEQQASREQALAQARATLAALMANRGSTAEEAALLTDALTAAAAEAIEPASANAPGGGLDDLGQGGRQVSAYHSDGSVQYESEEEAQQRRANEAAIARSLRALDDLGGSDFSPFGFGGDPWRR